MSNGRIGSDAAPEATEPPKLNFGNGVNITIMLASIDAPHFYAGIVLEDDIVIEAAPIVKYMRGWSRDKVRDYCKQKRWKISVVGE